MIWVYPVRCYEDPPIVPEWLVQTDDGRFYDARGLGNDKYEFEELTPAQLEQEIQPPAGPPPNGCTLRELIEWGRTAGLEQIPAARAEAAKIEKAWYSRSTAG
jgi:hypothetical protein